MAEESDAMAPGAAGDGAAEQLALAGASRDKADTYLDKQGRLAELQAQNLVEQNAFELSHLRFRRFSDWAKFALELSVGLVVLLIVAGLGTMVWNAAQDRDLVVDAFSVPADVSSGGMTGGVLAGRVLDSFGRMQGSIALSVLQGADSYRARGGEEVRVEIPQTGISLGELDRYLRGWLGHETRVTGDLVRTAKGYALTLRYGGAPGITVEGADLDALVAQAAEHLFAAVRPLRYLDYLVKDKRSAEALAAVAPLALDPDPQRRSSALAAWAGLLSDTGDLDAADAKAHAAVEADPANPRAVGWLSATRGTLGHDDASYLLAARNIGLWTGAEAADLDPAFAAQAPLFFTRRAASKIGDYRAAIAIDLDARRRGYDFFDPLEATEAAAPNHDIALARSLAAEIPATVDGKPSTDLAAVRLHIALAERDWGAAVAAGRAAEAVFGTDPRLYRYLHRYIWPGLAVALAHTGDFKAADAIVSQLRADNDDGTRARGAMAALRRDWRGAAESFAAVAAREPHIPFADTDWGEMLLAKGDRDGAIAEFDIAHRKSPHFADPLEMWGEALIAKNRSDLALAKFSEADKYAPHWGRLHLKWGEALLWSGDTPGAAKQFAAAGSLFLTPSEQAELSRVRTSHG